eukprot:1250856-Pyramimonas_sp.AAC.1
MSAVWLRRPGEIASTFAAGSMQNATLEFSRTVKLDGIKPVWGIFKPTDMAAVDDETFGRISPA